MKIALIGALICSLSTAAHAVTLQYTFDITGSQIDYQDLDNFSTDAAISDADYEGFVADNHVLGGLTGQTGQVVVRARITQPEFNDRFTGIADLFCVSGIICGNNRAFIAPHVGETWVDNSGFNSFGGGHEWGLSLTAPQGPTLSFFDDANIAGDAIFSDDFYVWWAPRATFSLAGDPHVEVISTPLPAGIALFAAAILPVGLLRRRKKLRV